MWIADKTGDYALLDTGGGEKLEDVGGIVLQRPDPQVIWERTQPRLWKPHAVYDRSSSGGGSWRFIKRVPEKWTISVGPLKFYVRPTGFKHIGVFPEQAANWDYIRKTIADSGREIRVLNLFAYTGGATLAALSAGASVVHVDAAKSMNEWAKENAQLSGLAGGSVRYIADDCGKFVQREQRRGNRYDAIIMDPPSYGRSGNSVWKIEDALYGLVKDCARAAVGSSAVLYHQLVYDRPFGRGIAQHAGALHAGRGPRGVRHAGAAAEGRCGAAALRDHGEVARVTTELKVLYEDNHLLVVEKPYGVPSQPDPSGDADMLTMAKAYIKAQYNKPGDVYIGLVHRLDRPTSGRDGVCPHVQGGGAPLGAGAVPRV